jgi:hypothetical protein
LRSRDDGRSRKEGVVRDDTFNLRDFDISRDLSSRALAFVSKEEEIRASAKGVIETGRELSVLALFDELRGLPSRRAQA